MTTCKNLEELVDTTLLTNESWTELINSITDKEEEWRVVIETAGLSSKSTNSQPLILKILQICGTKPEALYMNNNETPTDADDGNVQKIQEKRVKILSWTCGDEKFVNSLKSVIHDWSKKAEWHDTLGELHKHLEVFCSEVLQKLPLLGKDSLLNLICVSIGTIACNSKIQTAQPDLLGKFTALQSKIQEISKFYEEETKVKRNKFSEQEELLHSVEPPEDFREIPIIPTLDELLYESEPFLRPNKVHGPYRSSEHYLDVQFRLLREDFVRPLRRAVQEFMRNREEYIRAAGRKKANRQLDSDVRLYSDITFERTEQIREVSYDYLFNLPIKLANKINWDKSKRLLPGCLVMLTSDYCKSAIFATTLSPPYDPKQKRGEIKGDPRRQELAAGTVRLSVETGSELIDENKSYLMFECESLFEAYKHNLAILQKILFLENDGPERNSLNRLIVKSSSQIEYPGYFSHTEHVLKLPFTGNEKEEEMYVYPFRPDQWPADKIQYRMGLDPDQYIAFREALTSDIALIQGPPGTGKTYVGLQIVKALLLNKKRGVLPQSPFLVLCYTNHALDQFLELLLKEMPGLNVVRVGGQSKSEEVQKHTLVEHRKRLRGYYYNHDDDDDDDEFSVPRQKKEEANAFKKMNELEWKLKQLEYEIMELSSPNGIFKFNRMEVRNRLKEVLPQCLWETLKSADWLAVRSENFVVADFQLKQIVSHLFCVKPKFTNQTKHKQVALHSTINDKQEEGENVQEDVEYDMNELMEHRLLDIDDYKETLSGIGSINYDCYIEKCSTTKCVETAREAKKRLESLVADDFKMLKEMMDNNYNEACIFYNRLKIVAIEYENRANFFSTVFGLHKEERLEFHNVEKVFFKTMYGSSYEMKSNNVVKYPIRMKWGIYFKVIEIALKVAKELQHELKIEFEDAKKKYAEEKQKLDGCIVRNADVIGMTTTGAAKLHELLEFAKPEIVIVEEAAEILEAHVVTSLTEDCKHLILIGDHLQLQPSVNIYELATKYRLNISLFERMIRNDVPFYTLKTQHRMRPEISNLIIGSIYNELHNHENVFKYPPVKGVKKSLFVINHHEPEQTDNDLQSKSNLFEAVFLVRLCSYLLLQGYDPSKITILTAYTGQMFLLKKLSSFRGVRITCIDNFQGEENEIILLSLVRSNDEEKVGFVGKENRICVSLSRAKHGLFVVGNMDGMTAASNTWKKIYKKLIDGGNIGNVLELICERHKKVTEVKHGDDFLPLVNGGCNQICGAKLHCGHHCRQMCHALDQNHENYKCMERCTKTCSQMHQCVEICSIKCPPCKVRVPKTLPCDHKEVLPCHQNPSFVKCQAPVIRILSCALKHEVEIECNEDFSTLKCKMPVEKVLPCGHARIVECDIPLDEVKCDVRDEKILPCGHSRLMKCYQSISAFKCDVYVEKELPCGHKHKLKCCRDVENFMCDVIIDVVVPRCSHVVELPCYQSSSPKCPAKCSKELPCGHDCKLLCHLDKDPNHLEYKCKLKCKRSCNFGHPCDYSHDCCKKCMPCQAIVSISMPCGHTAELACSERESYKCTKKVEKTLSCGHKQIISCSKQDQKCTYHLSKCPRKCGVGHECSFEHACGEDCPPCEEKVEKILECGHKIMLPCHDNGEEYECEEVVEIKLKCGHNYKCYIVKLEEKYGYSVQCMENIMVECKKCNKEMLTDCWNKDNGICKDCLSETKRKTITTMMTDRGSKRSRSITEAANNYNVGRRRGNFGRGRWGRGRDKWRNFDSDGW